MPASPEPKPWNVLKSSGFDLEKLDPNLPLGHSSQARARAVAASVIEKGTT